MIDRKKLYDCVREPLFHGSITQSQVQGMEAVFNEWELSIYTDLRWLAYEFATIFHETGKTMQPVTESGTQEYLQSKPYYPYIGRGLTQTTWRYNYQQVKNFTGVDVLEHPDLMKDLKLSAKVALHFMAAGLYTGVGFKKYFSPLVENWKGARRIINGQDRAGLIAGYGHIFYAGLV